MHENARPHVAAVTRKKLSDIGFTVLPHAPYSPDLSPCDYYLFSPLKASLNGKIFESSEEITTHLQNWMNNKPTYFFSSGIDKLPSRWERCVSNDGNYFESLNETDL